MNMPLLNSFDHFPHDRNFVREAFQSILARDPDPEGERYYLEALRKATLSREELIRDLMNSDEAQTKQGLGIFETPQPNQTRDCFEPWDRVIVKADGTVYPCCSHSPVGTVTGDRTIHDVLRGPEVSALRHSLFSGRLDAYCSRCRSHALVDTATFRKRFSQHFFVSGRTLDANGNIDLEKHPELRMKYDLIGAGPNSISLNSGISVRPSREWPEPTIILRGLRLSEPSKLIIDIQLEDDKAPPTIFCVSMISGFVQSTEIIMTGKHSSQLSIYCPTIGSNFDLYLSARALRDADSLICAIFSYPFFDPVASSLEMRPEMPVALTDKIDAGQKGPVPDQDLLLQKTAAWSDLFDVDWYLSRNSDVEQDAERAPEHFVRTGAKEGRDPCALFSVDWYRSFCEPDDLVHEDPLNHYICAGAANGYDPNPFFDTDWYVAQNPDVTRDGWNPLQHYLRIGWMNGRDPHPRFSIRKYLALNSDVEQAGCEPLGHYLEFGRTEGRHLA